MSRKPYVCYVCQRNGFDNVMVFLAGKDANTKTIYLEEDGSPHVHKTKQGQQGQGAARTRTSTRFHYCSNRTFFIEDYQCKVGPDYCIVGVTEQK